MDTSHSNSLSFLNKRQFRRLLDRVRVKSESDFFSNESYSDQDLYKIWRDQQEGLIYPSFTSHQCNTKEDLIRIAGMAYSWMPTMMELYIKRDIDWQAIMSMIEKFKIHDLDIRKELMMELSLLINHSVVGAAKTLHIIDKSFAPIVDSRVNKGWNMFFHDEIEKGLVVKLPNSWSFNSDSTISRENKVNLYINYWDTLLIWRRSLDPSISLRDIEILFYFLGGKNKIRN